MLISLEASLDRLQTDYLDLYYAHRDYPELPVEQIVEAFDGAAKSGKVREIGASNFSAERLSAALDAADASGATPFTISDGVCSIFRIVVPLVTAASVSCWALGN